MEKLKQGDVIGGFTVKQHLSNGGMGDVYLVRDEKLAVERALKLISLTGPGFTGSRAELREYRERFAREARVLARLRHPNIIAVHAVGEHHEAPYIVMSHFPSVDGREWLNKERPNLERVRRVVLQLARALAHAHENGVIHRDIKLANFLIGKDDEAMLIDFGLAKHESDGDLTRVGRTMGTYSYLAPEYVRASAKGTQKHTVATDMWAMGCLLYVLTCGEPAFRNKDPDELLRAVARAQFVPVKQRAPGAPDQWSTLIHQLLEPDPQVRMKSAAELVAKLESIDVRANATQAAGGQHGDDFADAPPGQAGRGGGAAGAVRAEVAEEETSSAQLPVSGAPSRSIFDEPTGETADAALLPQPSFQLPAERAASGRASARRKLIFPLLAAAVVLALGSGVIYAIGRLGARSPRSTTYVDPEELQRRQRASSELEGLAAEKERRASLHTLELAPVPQPLPPIPPPAPAADTTSHSTPTRTKRTSAAVKPNGAIIAQTANEQELNPFLARYGTRTNYNTSAGAPSTTTTTTTAATATASAPPAAGTRIPVRVTSAIASAPLGPVIAVVQTATKLGATEIPRGAELHGRVTGAEGPRVLVEFSFALVNGKSVALKGIALGQDGRAGVPGTRNVGGPSDIAAGAAAGGAQALLEGAAALVGNDVAAGAVRGATAPIVNKAGRLDNEENLVVASAGARFLVYVESLL